MKVYYKIGDDLVLPNKVANDKTINVLVKSDKRCFKTTKAELNKDAVIEFFGYEPEKIIASVQLTDADYAVEL